MDPIKENIEGMERKSIGFKLDDEKEGTFVARIATLDVMDKDGDVTIPGAFQKGAAILISAYQHGSWMGNLPVGKAVINESGDEVLGVGEFNLKTEAGNEHYQAVKFSGELQEWSYGFKVLEVGSEKELDSWTDDHDGARPQRILKKLQVFEMSPVLLGAGVDTATLAIKSVTTYNDQAEMALATVEELVSRTKSLADLRAKEGRVLSEKNRGRMKSLLESISGVAADLKELLDATEPGPDDSEKNASAVLLVAKIKRELAEVI